MQDKEWQLNIRPARVCFIYLSPNGTEEEGGVVTTENLMEIPEGMWYTVRKTNGAYHGNDEKNQDANADEWYHAERIGRQVTHISTDIIKEI